MGVAHSFVPASNGENTFTRKWAGTSGSTVDPYISGYFFTKFTTIPAQLPGTITENGGTSGLTDVKDIKNLLSSACLSVTIPGGTLNKAEFTGLGGIKWAAPTNLDWDNTVSLKFLEFSAIPVFEVIHGWIKMIRDYRTGASSLIADATGGAGPTAYTRSSYTGTMYYWSTQPNGTIVEYAACVTGMFPQKDPTDQYGGDLSSIDKLELDIDFNADYLWREKWVRDKCVGYATEAAGGKSVVYEYDKAS